MQLKSQFAVLTEANVAEEAGFNKGGYIMFGDRDLANRYRPTTWEDIKGQTCTVELLRNQVLKKKGMSNVYLFHGPSGTGKTTIARMFFKAANCTQISSAGNACGKCSPCQEIFDFLEINGADQRGIDDMREPIQFSHNMPTGIFLRI